MDPRQEALSELETLLSRGKKQPLDGSACQRMVELTGLAPGRVRHVADVLASQRSSPGVDALLGLSANVPGVVEGVYQAFAHGVCRRRSADDSCPAMLAIDFRSSRAKNFVDILERATAVFGRDLERLRVADRLHYRVALFEGRGTLAGRAASRAQDLLWLQTRLAKLRGSRLWVNGWRFDELGPLRPPAHIHLLRAWLSWAAKQVQTRSAAR